MSAQAARLQEVVEQGEFEPSKIQNYKPSEVGPLPIDWNCTTVGELYRDAIIEKPMDGNHGNIHPRKSDFVEHGIPFVMANDVQNGVVRFDRCSFIRKKQADSLLKGFAVEGDVLLTHKATMGNTAIVGPISWPYIMLTPQVTYYRVTNKKRLSNLYLRHYFDSEPFQHRLEELSGGGTRAYLGIVGQHKLPIALPPTLAEQEAIAEVLGDADALVESLAQLLGKKRNLKQAAMQQLLTGKKRLPGFDAEWKTRAFGELATLRMRRVDPSRLECPSYCIELEHIEQGTGRLVGHTTTSGTSSLKSVFLKDDVLFGKLRAYLKKYWLASRDGVCSTEIWVLVATPDIAVPGFLHQIVQVDSFIEVASTAYGTHMPRSDWRVVQKYEVMVPPVTEQASIAEVLLDMDMEIAGIQAKIEKARKLKAGMMQELLTGKTRLV